jgi:hypothetical protein
MAFDRSTTLRVWERARKILADPQAPGEAKTFAKIARDKADVALGLDEALKRAAANSALSEKIDPKR